MIKKVLYSVISFFTLLTLSGIIAYLFYPKFFDINFYKDDIEKELERVLGFPLSIGNMDFSITTQGLGFEVRGLRSKGKDESGIEIKKAVLILEILPLIQERRVALKKLELYSPEIDIERDKDGNWLFAGMEGNEPYIVDIKSLMEGLIKGHIWINNGTVHFKDKWISKTTFSIDIDKINLRVMPYLMREKLAVSFGFSVPDENDNQAEVSIEGKVNNLINLDSLDKVTFNTNLKITSLSTKIFSPYIQHYIPSLEVNSDYTVNIESSLHRDKTGKAGAQGKIEKVNLSKKKEVVISKVDDDEKITLHYDIEGKENDVEIKKIKLDFDDYEVTASGTGRDIYSKDPELTVNLASSFIPLQKIKKSSLLSQLPDKIKNIATEYISTGSVKLTDITYSGKWSTLTAPDIRQAVKQVKGFLLIDKVDLTNLAPYGDIKNLNGNLELKNGDLFISKVILNYKNSNLENLSGVLRDIVSSQEAAVDLKVNMDFRQLNELFQNILTPQFSKKIIYPVGVANINMKISGISMKSDTYKYSGDIKIKNGSFFYSDIALPVQGLNGTLFFSQDHLESKKLELYMGKSLFNLNGILNDLKSQEPALDINLTASITGNNFFEKVLKIKSDVINLKEGKADGNITIKGKNDYAFSGNINLTDASIRYSNLLKKDKGIRNKIFARGYLMDKYLVLDAMNLTLGRSNFFIEGSFPFENTLPFVLGVKGDNVVPQQIFNFIPGVKEATRGVISGELYVIGNRSDPLDLVLLGGAKIKDSYLYFKDLPVENINGKVEFSGDKVMLDSVKFNFDGSEIETSGVMTGFKNPIIGFKIDAKSFNLDHLFPENQVEEEKSAETSEEESQTNIAGTVSLKKGRYRNLSFEDLKMNLFINDKGVHADPFSLKGLGGNFSGKWRYRYEEPSMFTIEGDFNDINIKEMDERLDLQLTELEGTGDAKVKLSGIAGETKKFKKSMNGDISLLLRNGKVHRLKVLSSIFSILNLSMPELMTKGTSYKTFKGDVHIKKGVAETTNFLLDSNAFRMTGVGNVDVGYSKINMVVGVQPFQAIDKVISHIPIVGRVLTGDEKALITSYYSVKGNLEDPDVSAMPVKSVGKGIMGIFKRLFTLPKDLIQGKM